MKRLILILCSALILNIICVNATEIRDLKVTQNSVTGRCMLSGNTDEPAGTMLSILISKSSEKDKPIFLSGAIVGENGKIAYDFYMPQTAARGVYILKTGTSGGAVAEVMFSYRNLYGSLKDASVYMPNEPDYVQNKNEANFEVYCYSEEQADYRVEYTDTETGENGKKTFSVNACEHTAKRISVSDLSYGVHSLEISVYKNNDLASQTNKKITIIRKNSGKPNGKSSIGVHTHMSLEDSDGNKEKMKLINAAGIKNVRPSTVFRWNNVESKKGIYGFKYEAELFKNRANESGVSVLFPAKYVNNLYSENPPVTEPERKAFADYVNATLDMYPEIDKVEIWNEPDLQRFWKNGGADAVQYTNLVKTVSEAVRKEHPNVEIIAGSVSSAGNSDGTDFMGNMMKNGIYSYVDGISFHPYGWNPNPNYNYNAWKAKFEKPIDASGAWLDIYNTEIGWPTVNVNGVFPITQEAQASYLVKAFVQNDGSGYKETYWYNLRNTGTSKSDAEQQFGLIENDYTPKKSYVALCQLIYRVDGAQYIGKLNIGNGAEGHIYKKDGKFVMVAWTGGSECEYTLNPEATVEDIYGNVKGYGTVTLASEPVYITNVSRSCAAKAAAETICAETDEVTADWSENTNAERVLTLINEIWEKGEVLIKNNDSDSELSLKLYKLKRAAHTAAAYYSCIYGGDMPMPDYETLRLYKSLAKNGENPYVNKYIKAAEGYYNNIEEKETKTANILMCNGILRFVKSTLEKELQNGSRIVFNGFTDKNGESINKIGEETEIYADYSVMSKDGAELFAAAYSADGKLIGLEHESVPQGAIASVGIKIENTEKVYKIKTFAVNNITALMPLTEASCID